MNKLRIFFFIISILLISNKVLHAKKRDWEQGLEAKAQGPTLSVGYNFLGYNEGYGHGFDIGIGTGTWGFLYGYGIIGSLAGLVTDGKFTIGPKISVQANILVFSGRLEVNYLHPYANINPGLGITAFGFASIYGGYNICVENTNKSGFNLYLNCSIPFHILSKKDN